MSEPATVTNRLPRAHRQDRASMALIEKGKADPKVG